MDGYCYFFFDLDCAAKGFIDVFKKEKNPACYSFHGKIKSSFIKDKNMGQKNRITLASRKFKTIFSARIPAVG